MKSKILFILCAISILFLSASANSQTIKSGEKLVYAGSYNMSGLMTQLAQVTMSTENLATAKNNYLHLSCELSTYSKWDSFFKIRDIYESYVNPLNLKPSLYKRSIDEGGWTKKEKYVFKGTTVNSTSKRKNSPETQKTFTIGASTQDVISLLYKVRTMDLSKFKSHSNIIFVNENDQKDFQLLKKSQIIYMKNGNIERVVTINAKDLKNQLESLI